MPLKIARGRVGNARPLQHDVTGLRCSNYFNLSTTTLLKRTPRRQVSPRLALITSVRYRMPVDSVGPFKTHALAKVERIPRKIRLRYMFALLSFSLQLLAANSSIISKRRHAWKASLSAADSSAKEGEQRGCLQGSTFCVIVVHSDTPTCPGKTGPFVDAFHGQSPLIRQVGPLFGDTATRGTRCLIQCGQTRCGPHAHHHSIEFRERHSS